MNGVCSSTESATPGTPASTVYMQRFSTLFLVSIFHKHLPVLNNNCFPPETSEVARQCLFKGNWPFTKQFGLPITEHTLS